MATDAIRLQGVIAECLAAHAEAVERLGTDQPELIDGVSSDLRDKMLRQRQKVSASLEGVDPAVHVQHVAALTKGVRLVIKRLSLC
jgi:hypothetical protein